MYTRYCKMGCKYPLQRSAEWSDKRLCIIWVELKLHKQCIQSAFRVARETEKVVSFTESSLNTFCPNNNNASQSWPTVQLAVPLCACTWLLVQHYSYCACTGQLVQHYSNCACTGLLVQHYSNCAWDRKSVV